MGKRKMNIEIDSPTQEEIMAEVNEMRQRGIDYLLSKRGKEKQPNEFSARELVSILGYEEASIYSYMEKLVAAGEWETRHAFDPETHKTLRVWWLKQ